MVDSKKLLLALVVLQIATLSLLLLIFLSPERGPSAGGTFVISGSHANQAQPVPISALQTEIRALVRAEMAADMAGSGDQPAPSEQELESQEQAAAASGSVIRGAIAAGVWTHSDTQSLLPHIGRISSEQRKVLMEEFYAAINRQELQLEDVPPL